MRDYNRKQPGDLDADGDIEFPDLARLLKDCGTASDAASTPGRCQAQAVPEIRALGSVRIRISGRWDHGFQKETGLCLTQGDSWFIISTERIRFIPRAGFRRPPAEKQDPWRVV